MNFVKLSLRNNRIGYSYQDASNIRMCILGMFLATDVGCGGDSIFREWALADKNNPDSGFIHHAGGNATQLEERKNGYIYLCDGTLTFEEMDRSKKLRMSRNQFVRLLDDWKEKVCALKPKEVMIKHENGQFIIETKD